MSVRRCPGEHMPRFSVVIPAYNAEATLAETIDAVLAQSCNDWECVIVDDGSSDGTAAVARRYADLEPRVRVVSQSNMGSGGAYNAGVRDARGDFIVLCSADDVLLPEHLEQMSAFVDREPDFDIYSTNGYFWKPDGSRELVYSEDSGQEVMSLTLADVIQRCFYGVGAAYRRELFDKVGGYRVAVFGEDYDFWLRSMALGARHRYLPQPLSLHRLSPTQKSAALERAYRSDIQLITELGGSFSLSAEELRAVDDAVRERERLIARLRRQRWVEAIRRTVAKAVVGLLGKERARRLAVRLHLRPNQRSEGYD